MDPLPVFNNSSAAGSGKLNGKIALITGGDSGIGRAVAILFAKEGADIAISYLNEEEDAALTLKMVKQLGRKGIGIAGDLSKKEIALPV